MTQAWRQRRMLDDMISVFERDPQMSTLSGQLQAIRRELSSEMEQAASVAGVGPQWAASSRDTQLGIFMREHGRGSERLSVGGGVGGAAATGDLVSQAVTTGSPLAVAASIPQAWAARAASQEARMLFPGVRAVAGETSASVRRSVADALYRHARSGSLLRRYSDVPAVRALMDAARRGHTSFSTALSVLAQRDAQVRELMREFEEMTPDSAMDASGEMQQ